MPFSGQEQPRLSNYEADERAAEAKAILSNPVFRRAMQDVYSGAVNRLVSADINSLTASAAHAMMKAVIDVQKQLEQYIDDSKMRQKYRKGDPNG